MTLLNTYVFIHVVIHVEIGERKQEIKYAIFTLRAILNTQREKRISAKPTGGSFLGQNNIAVY